MVKPLLHPQCPTLQISILQRLLASAEWSLASCYQDRKEADSPCYSIWLRHAAKGLIPVTQHAGARAGGQAGSAEADLWPLRKGMWKLFHPGQKPKTPRRLERGGSILLSTFLIRGSKQGSMWMCCVVFAATASAILGSEFPSYSSAFVTLQSRWSKISGWNRLQFCSCWWKALVMNCCVISPI